MTAPERPQEPRRASERWIDVLAPPFSIRQPSKPSDAPRKPRWLERAQAKDLTGQVRDGAE